ncbi:conserved hypothetical protein [Talaromyces stipitatus ATCC 10500]|uniref:Mitotic checkpoint regulator, MAD2B-interacting-domain-containing protein n=1 Tax=Talaromyces stipitatus (strain ATCC 10500 / CBS 375.48 / QM 6759 / NRRL 1006) TaxID=441959 RepID=B8MLH8_TALSN|nr:uncharacterized protein TSTA_049480 [Talaromyces stipitatus ATCC 10500]EED15511.1 conserved hypothetical protein [Talaromyces stipitatus ATCC 10500]
MGLVQYSDSEVSDDEEQPQVTQPITKNTTAETKPDQKFSSIVDRGNPRKIRVALPEIKPENKADDSIEDDEDGPARKKPRTTGGGIFSGFNSLLPAPKRANLPTTSGGNASKNTKADAEWRQEQALDQASMGGSEDDTIPKPGSLRNDPKEGSLLKEENYKKKGNAMVFKPLSVARNAPKKKSAAFVAARAAPAAVNTAQKANDSDTPTERDASIAATTTTTTAAEASPATKPKPKISLFSFSNEDKTTSTASTSAYESIVYNPEGFDAPSNTGEDISALEQHNQPSATYPTPSTQQQSTLDAIANDLNLSRAQRRQLLGRNPGTVQANSKILTFNTDAEYASNQELLSKTTEEELTAQQHNPVRAIAPGKHSLRQLVQAASSQKDALEESFATGRRNKKEAGSRYGW